MALNAGVFNYMNTNIDQTILIKLSDYRKKRRSAVYLGISIPVIFGLGFIFELFWINLSKLVFIIGAICFVLWIIKVNLNCYKKCPRCGRRFCMKGLYIWCWPQRCIHCEPDLKATELSEL